MATNRLRVLLDTNIYISYLLHPHGTGPIAQIMRAGLARSFMLLVPERLFDELAAVVVQKS